MTSQFKVQGSLKALVVTAATVVLSMSSMQASAQAGPRGAGPRGVPARPPVRATPPRPVIVVPPCKRGGPGITPC